MPENFAHLTPKASKEDPLESRSCGPLTSNYPTQEIVEGISRPNPVDIRESQYGVRISRASGIECPLNSDDFDISTYKHPGNVDELINTPLDEAWAEQFTFTAIIWCN